MSTSCTDNSHPYYEQISKLRSEEVRKFFTDKPDRMSFVSLGELLDFTSFGGMNYVVWPNLSINGMVQFIDSWMKSQKPRITYDEVPIEGCNGSYRVVEKTREFGYLWNRFDRDFDEALPIIRGKSCSEEGHYRKIRDIGGRVRCGEFSDSDEGERNACYRLISEEGITLPLESILLRLSVGDSFPNPKRQAIFPFSGFSVANFTKSWFKQEGDKQLYLPEGKREDYRAYPKFTPVSSDD